VPQPPKVDRMARRRHQGDEVIQESKLRFPLMVDAPQTNLIVDSDGHTNIPAPKVPPKSNGKTGVETIVDLAGLASCGRCYSRPLSYG
jgi:hypothetical protein